MHLAAVGSDVLEDATCPLQERHTREWPGAQHQPRDAPQAPPWSVWPPAPQNTTQTHTYKEALQHTKSLVPHTVCDTTGTLSLCSRLSQLQPFQHVSLACHLLWYLELESTVRSPLPPRFFSSSKPEDYFQVFCMASPYKTLKLPERRVHSTFHPALEQLLLAGKHNDMKLLQDCRVSGPLKLNFIYNYIAVT